MICHTVAETQDNEWEMFTGSLFLPSLLSYCGWCYICIWFPKKENLSYNLNISEQFLRPLITFIMWFVLRSELIGVRKDSIGFWKKSFSVREWGVSLNSKVLLMYSNSTKSSPLRIIWHYFNSFKFNNFVCFTSICHSPEKKKIFQAVYIWNFNKVVLIFWKKMLQQFHLLRHF